MGVIILKTGVGKNIFLNLSSFVFAVKNRQRFIVKENKEDLHKDMTALLQNRKAKMQAIHCMAHTAHIFAGIQTN